MDFRISLRRDERGAVVLLGLGNLCGGLGFPLHGSSIGPSRDDHFLITVFLFLHMRFIGAVINQQGVERQSIDAFQVNV